MQIFCEFCDYSRRGVVPDGSSEIVIRMNIFLLLHISHMDEFAPKKINHRGHREFSSSC